MPVFSMMPGNDSNWWKQFERFASTKTVLIIGVGNFLLPQMLSMVVIISFSSQSVNKARNRRTWTMLWNDFRPHTLQCCRFGGSSEFPLSAPLFLSGERLYLKSTSLQLGFHSLSCGSPGKCEITRKFWYRLTVPPTRWQIVEKSSSSTRTGNFMENFMECTVTWPGLLLVFNSVGGGGGGKRRDQCFVAVIPKLTSLLIGRTSLPPAHWSIVSSCCCCCCCCYRHHRRRHCCCYHHHHRRCCCCCCCWYY